MLKLHKIKKEYAEVLFEDISFILGNKEKVALVGLNGCGKSTLLKIITGEERPDSGTVEIANEKLGYLPQEFVLGEHYLVGEYIESLVDDVHSERYKVDKTLGLLSFGEIDDYRELSTLSGGERMKLYLARLLLAGSTLLLLDEPTNHLDIEGIIWMEAFIKQFDGIAIIISHDRSFLNNCVDKVFEIDEKKVIAFEGNYDDYLIGKNRYIEDRKAEFKAQERKREQLEALLEKARRGLAGKKAGKRVRAAKKRIEREVLSNEVDDYRTRKVRQFNLDGSLHGQKTVLKTDELSFGYDENLLFEDVTFSMYGKEKVWLLGKNGIGKTTLIKILMGNLKPTRGTFAIGSNITWSYFSQDQSHIDMNSTVEDYFVDNTKYSFEESFGVLERFLFPKDLRKYYLKSLSPGQRARLSFAIFAQQSYDFLILDEPTNHLDIRTKEVIEDALREYKGSIFLISHDRYFAESLGIDRVVTIEDRRLNEL